MIKFHLPECSTHASLNLTIARLVKERKDLIGDGVEIASFFGSPNLIWNGGRMMLTQYQPARYKELIRAYNEQGIPYRFTFTNPLITEEYLDDYDCNDMLDFADNGMNEVIVYSPVLEEYIRKTHPNMKVTSSTCKCIRDINEVKAELAKPYSLVVLDFNFNNDFVKLEQLTPEERKRCEILSNPVCRPGCTRRAEHYEYIGNIQLHYKEIMEKLRRMPPEEREKHSIKEWECKDRELDIFSKKYPLRVTPELIREKYVPMGFENFKIEGRAANMMMLGEQIARYFAAEGKVDELRLELMMVALNNYGINFK
ncbi:MAG: hypothetical protein J6I96_04120 [Oscillospiraceae bacterium]|nr:hypothetical protein [Oscillospiraceae bacterium]